MRKYKKIVAYRRTTKMTAKNKPNIDIYIIDRKYIYYIFGYKKTPKMEDDL